MADTIDVNTIGRSKFEIAEGMARTILITIEHKNLKDCSREDYLQAVYQSIDALNGVPPS